jgi:serine O-acetyltransferase
MSAKTLNRLMEQTVSELSESSSLRGLFHKHNDGEPLPSGAVLSEIVDLCRAIIFPGFYGNSTLSSQTLPYHMGMNVERLYTLLSQQIQAGLCFCKDDEECEEKLSTANAHLSTTKAQELAAEFIARLPQLRNILATDVEATYNGDPAAESYGEIISCYPVIKAVTNYRIAHELLVLGVPLIPRIITEMAHSETGIDIHPAATIGSHFTIDHGTGVVIGATCIIGNNVKLYQGVTLGAKSFPLDENGNPIKNIPRHPILEDDVIVYSNATILGRITLAKGTVVGGNLWVTESTQPGEQLVQAKKRKSHVVRPEDWGGL